MDTPRTAAPTTFMSNMLYACSILYKTRLPLVLAFNKTDVLSHAFAAEWMADFEKFQEVRAAVRIYLSIYLSVTGDGRSVAVACPGLQGLAGWLAGCLVMPCSSSSIRPTHHRAWTGSRRTWGTWPRSCAP